MVVLVLSKYWNTTKNAIINFDAYLFKNEKELFKMASEWQTTRGEKSIHQKASRYNEDLGKGLDALVNLNKQQRKIRIKERREAVLHGKYMRLLQ